MGLCDWIHGRPAYLGYPLRTGREMWREIDADIRAHGDNREIALSTNSNWPTWIAGNRDIVFIETDNSFFSLMCLLC